ARPDFQLHLDVLAGLQPLREPLAPRLEGVHPALDREDIAADFCDRELAAPAVVDQELHRSLAPVRRRRLPDPDNRGARLRADDAAIETALSKAWDARYGWRDAGVGMRASLMRSVAGVLRADRSRYAALLTSEMGKPIVEAEAEVEKCAWTAGWFAEKAERLLAEERIESTASESYVRFQPLGVVLAVMPWNFPFWQAFRAGLPALSAGNVMLLKHSSNVPQSALAIEEVFREGGVPEGVFQTLLIGSAAVER